MKDGLKIKGFYRLQVKEGEAIVGDTGFFENQVTNAGVDDFLLTWAGAGAGGKQITFAALGTGSEPAKTDTVLAGENGARVSVASSLTSNATYRILQMTGQFASGTDMATGNLNNIGLFNSSAIGGSMFSGATFASSSIASNQSILFTYSLQVSN